ncbi:hypothetical protein B0H14DRAFT_2602740 [Mycena olivaceomarginata]|nr:hypothetical protein B0H14DRAFT_2602740 [Mycena olivaceomarginata]
MFCTPSVSANATRRALGLVAHLQRIQEITCDKSCESYHAQCRQSPDKCFPSTTRAPIGQLMRCKETLFQINQLLPTFDKLTAQRNKNYTVVYLRDFCSARVDHFKLVPIKPVFHERLEPVQRELHIAAVDIRFPNPLVYPDFCYHTASLRSLEAPVKAEFGLVTLPTSARGQSDEKHSSGNAEMDYGNHFFSDNRLRSSNLRKRNNYESRRRIHDYIQSETR